MSSSSWGLGRAAVCDCDTPWTFLLPFLLSRIPQNDGLLQEEVNAYEPDVSDKTYEIGALNSNRFSPKDYARCETAPSDVLEKPSLGDDLDIVVEQSKDNALMEEKQAFKMTKFPKQCKRNTSLLMTFCITSQM